MEDNKELIFTTYTPYQFEKLIKRCIGVPAVEIKTKSISIDPQEKLSQTKAAEYLGITVATLINWKKKGLIPYYQADKSVFFIKTELLEALRKNPKINK